MRIATWNLERGGKTRAARIAQDDTIRDLAADVFVLTEPGPSFDTGPGVVTSPRRRTNRNGHESWIAIIGDAVEPVTPLVWISFAAGGTKDARAQGGAQDPVALGFGSRGT